MYRGTTPTLDFTIPFDTELISELYLTFSQKDKPLFEKQKSDCKCESNVISVRLSQEETLKLDDAYSVEMQMRVKTTEDEVLASEIIKVSVSQILKDGVI